MSCSLQNIHDPSIDILYIHKYICDSSQDKFKKFQKENQSKRNPNKYIQRDQTKTKLFGIFLINYSFYFLYFILNFKQNQVFQVVNLQNSTEFMSPVCKLESCGNRKEFFSMSHHVLLFQIISQLECKP